MAMVLAAAAVHTHLVRKGLRSYASINVRSAEVLDTHAFAVLVGVGATTVHAYLAEAAIADRQSRGLFGELSLDECRLRFRKAIDDGRSEERGVGKAWVRTCRCRWSPYP